jgi:signal transduction histidine kinase
MSQPRRTVFSRVALPSTAFATCVALLFAGIGHAALPVIIDHVSEHLLVLETERIRRSTLEHGAVPVSTPFSIAYRGLRALPLPLRARVEHLSNGTYELSSGRGRETWVSRSSLDDEGEPLFVILELPKEPFAIWKGIIALGALGIFVSGVTLALWNARRIARPLTALAALVERTPPERLADAFEAYELDQEVQGLVGRLKTSLRALDASAAREERFTRYASHELRTPITVIQGALELLGEIPDAQTASVRRPLERIERATSDMRATVESFLWLAREADESTLPQVALGPIVANVVARYRHLLEGKPIELTITDGESLGIAAPPGVLEIVIGNLVANAFHYTERGKIAIELTAERITVSDTGPGMRAEQVENLGASSSFVRGDKRVGYGLGLSIVRYLCARFGWTLDMTGTTGVGTQATLRFRVVPALTDEDLHLSRD